MPSFADIENLLLRYRRRYRYLAVFVDDVDEFRAADLAQRVAVIEQSPLRLSIPTSRGRMVAEVATDKGVARFELTDRDRGLASTVAGSAAVDGLIGSAIGAATGSKDGLLGGLVLGMLSGALVGAAITSPDSHRIFSLLFDHTTGEWRVYDGPFLPWAKQQLAG